MQFGQIMDVQEGKLKFIESWGLLATHWGINRTMAQIHALLLVSSEPMCSDQIIEALQISRGNANMNIRALIDWGLVYKKIMNGERKEFFVAEKDVWEVFRRILLERKKRELEPMLKVLDELAGVNGNCQESEEFCKMVKDIKLMSTKADATLNRLAHSDSRWFLNTFLSLV
jgi:DNA-binding transcriptional regulator GbsR (MarR family)